MAETKSESVREYIIPLRNEWRKVANYRRTGRAVKEIKKFIARHMKVPDRDLSKVKLDVYLNNEVWFRGRKKPPAKIKVRARKEGDIVKVELAEIPEYVRFLKQKHDKSKEKLEKIAKPQQVKEKKDEEVKKEDEEKKKEEKEKEQSIAQLRAMEAKQDTKAKQHTTKVKEQIIHRMALKK